MIPGANKRAACYPKRFRSLELLAEGHCCEHSIFTTPILLQGETDRQRGLGPRHSSAKRAQRPVRVAQLRHPIARAACGRVVRVRAWRLQRRPCRAPRAVPQRRGRHVVPGRDSRSTARAPTRPAARVRGTQGAPPGHPTKRSQSMCACSPPPTSISSRPRKRAASVAVCTHAWLAQSRGAGRERAAKPSSG